MSHIFISHVEEDADIALEIALGLEEAAYKTWSYETDSIPDKYVHRILKAKNDADLKFKWLLGKFRNTDVCNS